MKLVALGLFVNLSSLAFQFLESCRVQYLGEHLSVFTVLFAKSPLKRNLD